MCSDKYTVRQYVKKRGYSDILTELYGVYKSTNEIQPDKLPKSFVLKTNHSCHCVYICRDKATFDWDKAIKGLEHDLQRDFSRKKHEYHYSAISPMILCEELINDGTGFTPTDYKFFCFSGEPECVLVCSDRGDNLKQNWFDTNWDQLQYNLNTTLQNLELKRPKLFSEMLLVAQALSKEFPFVRVDLYCTPNRIFFGELTFTPCAGFIDTMGQDALDKLGSRINLNMYIKNN